MILWNPRNHRIVLLESLACLLRLAVLLVACPSTQVANHHHRRTETHLLLLLQTMTVKGRCHLHLKVVLRPPWLDYPHLLDLVTAHQALLYLLPLALCLLLPALQAWRYLDPCLRRPLEAPLLVYPYLFQHPIFHLLQNFLLRLLHLTRISLLLNFLLLLYLLPPGFLLASLLLQEVAPLFLPLRAALLCRLLREGAPLCPLPLQGVLLSLLRLAPLPLACLHLLENLWVSLLLQQLKALFLLLQAHYESHYLMNTFPT